MPTENRSSNMHRASCAPLEDGSIARSVLQERSEQGSRLKVADPLRLRINLTTELELSG